MSEPREHDVDLTSGIRVHVTEAGPADAEITIVLLHGVMMSSRFFQRQLAGPLTAGYRVIAPDYRGHGRSAAAADGHTVAGYARDLHDLLEVLGVERPVLVGWSMGTMVAYEYIKAYGSDSVRGLVVVDQPPSDFAWPDYPYGVITLATLAELVEGLQNDQQALAAEFADLMIHAPTDEGRAWMAEEICRVAPAVASTILVDQTLRDFRPLLPEITCPSLVVFGADPKFTNPEAGTYIAEQIPGARFEIFAESSHCPFLEEPERFDQLLGDFVRSATAGS